jgi:hypothetical protein
MTPSENFRALAKAERYAATKTALPRQRDMHERSAMAWDQMAESAEDTVAKSITNATARANGSHPPSGSHDWRR